MAKRGRKPKPTAIKIAEGNPGKRRLNTNEPKPGAPLTTEPPAHMAEKGVELWRQVVPELERIGLLTRVDYFELVRYCDAWALYVNARENIAIEGATFVTDKGNEMQSPWVSIANNQHAVMAKLAVEFGFTPSSRCRVSAPPPQRPEDELNDFLSQGAPPAMKIAT